MNGMDSDCFCNGFIKATDRQSVLRGVGAGLMLKRVMKLKQDQLWKKGDDYFRIVERERLSVKYKSMKDLIASEGTTHLVTKKEFCRLIKGAELLAVEPWKSEASESDLADTE